MTLVIVWLLIPLLATIVYSLFEDWTGIIPKGFTLENYKKIFSDTAFLTSMYQTLIVCIVPIVITILVVLLALFVVTVYFPRLEKYIQILCMIPYTIQGVILSVSILILYAKGSSFLSGRMIMLFGAYCIIISTGRGTPFGCPVPTIKIASNTPLAEKKPGWIDFNAGRLLDGTTLPQLGRELMDYVLSVASGHPSRNEQNGFHDLALFKKGVTL